MIQFSNHAFKGLDASLERLYALLQDMGASLVSIIDLLPAGLEHPNAELFQTAKEIDKRVNEMELQADAAVAAIINKFTVMGEELRFTLGAIKAAGTLERAADKTKNCSKRLSRLSTPLAPAIKSELSKAINALKAMVPLTMAQLVDYKAEVTRDLLSHGTTVQESYKNVLLQLHAHSTSATDEAHILLVAKNLEQAADMAVEIMKNAHFIHFATKYDKAANN